MLAALPDDSHVSPAGILPGQPEHQLDHRRVQPSASPGRRVGPASTDQLTVPTWQRRRRGQEDLPPVAGEQTGRCGQNDPIRGCVAGPSHLSAQHGDLVTQHRDLNIVCLRCRTAAYHPEDPPQDNERQGPRHHGADPASPASQQLTAARQVCTPHGARPRAVALVAGKAPPTKIAQLRAVGQSECRSTSRRSPRLPVPDRLRWHELAIPSGLEIDGDPRADRLECPGAPSGRILHPRLNRTFSVWRSTIRTAPLIKGDRKAGPVASEFCELPERPYFNFPGNSP